MTDLKKIRQELSVLRTETASVRRQMWEQFGKLAHLQRRISLVLNQIKE